MHLIYFDESGNSGGNLTDPRQPVFVLCALVVAETRWQALERDLAGVIEHFWPSPRPDHFEIHASELINPKAPHFRQAAPPHRLRFLESWLTAAARHEVRLVFRAIAKDRYHRWLVATFGSGVVINPHVAAMALVAQVVNNYLRTLPGAPLGIIISDENHQVARDVDKAIRLLRAAEGAIRLTQIIEKGFFIESDKSLVLQLCDVFAYVVRRHEEIRLGRPSKPVDEVLWAQIEPLVVVGDERLKDINAWLAAGQKKERPGA